MQFTLAEIPRILPELLLLVLALLVLGSDIFEKWADTEAAQIERSRAAGSLTAIGLGLILVIVLLQSGYVYQIAPDTAPNIFTNLVRNLQAGGPNAAALTGQPAEPILGAFATDHLTMIARLIFVLAALLTALLAYDAKIMANPGEFYALLLVSTVGMCLMAGATELITAYLAVELTSIPLYILAGYFRSDAKSSEAGMKYFLFGAISSCILLYGMSLAYGFAANASNNGPNGGFLTQFAKIADVAGSAGSNSTLLTLAMIFIVAGVGYKVAVVPFHAWSPDVYQGAPTTVTAFVSTASKTAGFLLLLRVLTEAFPGLTGAASIGLPGIPNPITTFTGWASLLALLALLTIVFGNLAALPQTNAKRMLAYSSIGHAGFLLLGLVAWSSEVAADRALGTSSLLYYLLVYTITNLGAFGALALIGQAVGGDDMSDMNGLARRNLPLAILFTLCILSLAGIPPLAGFFAKFYVFMAAWQGGAWPVVIVAVVMTIVSLYYYLRFLRAIFIEAPASSEPIAMPRAMQATLIVSALLILVLGLYPNLVLSVIDQVQLVAGR